MIEAVPSKRLLFWKKEKLCAKYYKLAKEDFLISDGRICSSGYRRCGRTLSEFLCVKSTLNCPINEFIMTNDADTIPDKVHQSVDQFYYAIDFKNSAAKFYYTHDNPEGYLLTNDFDFSFQKVCMDQKQKTISEDNIPFKNYKYVEYLETCPDEINKIVHNHQFIHRKNLNN